MLTTDDFVKELHKFYTADIKPNERQMVLRTGTAGMELIHLAMEKQNNLDFTDFLVEKGIVTSEEGELIKKMINSPDPENYEMVKVILKEKSYELTPEKHGYNNIGVKGVNYELAKMPHM